jgi:hypothetical protein
MRLRPSPILAPVALAAGGHPGDCRAQQTPGQGPDHPLAIFDCRFAVKVRRSALIRRPFIREPRVPNPDLRSLGTRPKAPKALQNAKQEYPAESMAWAVRVRVWSVKKLACSGSGGSRRKAGTLRSVSLRRCLRLHNKGKPKGAQTRKQLWINKIDLLKNQTQLDYLVYYQYFGEKNWPVIEENGAKQL